MSYINYVNIKHGTASLPRFSNGNTLPLVQMPFGMNGYAVQTESNRGNWFYHPEDRAIEGVRITHQPSPWIGDHTPLVMYPQRDECFVQPDMRWSGYRPEEAILKPNYLKADFLRYRTSFELAPTTRGGVVRLIFEGEERSSFSLISDLGYSQFEVDEAKGSLTGWTRYTSWDCEEGFRMYFAYSFDCELVQNDTFILHKDGKIEPGRHSAGHGCGINVGLSEKQVIVRFATSFVSVEQAIRNLNNEVEGKSFEAVKDTAGDKWEGYLSRIEIETGDEEMMKLFYSSMYRSFLFPTKSYEYNENNEPIHYCSDTGAVKKGVKYINNGFWDTFRTIYPLFSLVAREEFAEILEGFVATYNDCGWLPKWPSPNEVGMMPGTLIDAVIAEAATKNIGDRKLLENAFDGIMKHVTTTSGNDRYGRRGVDDYNRYGYMPYDLYHESVNNTLDYVYGDFCNAQTAKILGKDEAYDAFMKSSTNYRKLFDPTTGFMRGRDRDGHMAEDFNEFAWGGDYCEGGAWQSSFAVYHDIEGLAKLYGGKDQLMAKIDTLFDTKPYYTRGSYANEIHEMTEMAAADFGQCAISNQPSFHIPYIYAALGKPEKTEYWVTKLLKEGFSPKDDGFPGDEDNGTTAAWVIFSILGLFPFCPGKPEYLRITPQVDKVTIHSGDVPYVYRKDDIREPVVSHSELVKG